MMHNYYILLNNAVFLCSVVILHLCSTDAKCLSKYEFPYSIFLDNDHTLQLSWKVNYRKEIVSFRLCGSIKGFAWFGIGFSDYGDLDMADFAVFWTSTRGIHHFQDSHTDSEGVLHLDTQQDYALTHGQSDKQHTQLDFFRKFDTCDVNDYQFDRGTTHIVYFISTSPFSSLNHVNVSAMTTGLQRVQLLKPDIRPTSLPENTWTFDITAPNIEVPAKETTYWWYTMKLPPLRHKHHIVKYEGIIQKGHENLVHHMEVFHCEVSANEIIRYYNGPGQSEGKPPELGACRKVIGAWAMGATAMVLPEEAGFPLGGPKYSRYVLLEIHYNNPHSMAGMIDASGVRFSVTSSLRQHDAGIMELGLEYTNKMAIPPRQKLFPLTGYCIKECTAVGLPSKGIHIYASQLHTHLTGRRVYTKHVRHYRELPELNRDNHYSPHFQEIRLLPRPVHILPGDDLITTCEDRTVDRTNATIGGFAISDEMCVNYVHYYPLIDLEVCKSSISTESLNNFFQFMNRWDLDETIPGAGDRANYQSIKWTPLTTVLLKALYETSSISMQCNQSNGERFPGKWEGVAKSQVRLPLSPEVRKCDRQ